MTNMKNSNFYKKTAQALGTPVFIYWEKRLETNISRIKQAAEHHLANRELGIYIPYFTNSNPYLFSIVRKHGCGIAIQSTEEWHQLNAHNLADKLIASPTVLPQEELKFLLEKGVRVNLSSIDEVEWQINNFPEKNIFIRLDISVDSSQRTGIKPWEITGLRKILKKNNKALAGVHIYVGTLSTFEKIVKYTDIVLALVSREFPEIEVVNLGGGFHYNYEKTFNQHFDWDAYFVMLAKKIGTYNLSPNMKFEIEPGRDVFADVGELVLSIHHVVWNERGTICQIFTDGSYVYMPSATVRERKHQLLFLDSQFKESSDRSISGWLNGSTTLSSDFLLPVIIEVPLDVKSGHFVIVKDIGAYGATQHLEFLNRRPAAEALITDNKVQIINERGAMTDKIRSVPQKPIFIK